MCDKVIRVSRWLQSVFGEQRVPDFEVTARTIDILDHLVHLSEARCEDVQLLIDDHRQKAAEYSIDSAHLKELLLQSVDLRPESDSKPTSNFLSVLEGTTEVLKVKDTSMGSFVTAINELTHNLAKAENTDRQLERELLAMRKKTAAALLQKKTLHGDIKKTVEDHQLEAAATEEKLLSRDFASNKTRDFNFYNKTAMDELTVRKMEKGLGHEVIVDLSEQVFAVEQEIKLLEKKLKPYSDLCPCPKLARVKIEEAKRELAALDSELEKKIDLTTS